MSFWTDVGEAASSALGNTLGSTAGSYVANTGITALNNPSNSRKENRKNFHQDMEQQWKWDVKRANLGRDIDVGAQQEMFDFRMQRGKDAGMTDYEMYMGPAAGAGGGTGAATQTLGNGGTSAANNLRQQATQQKIATEEKQKDRIASLAQTAMQTKAQKDVAQINTGATTRGQDIQADIAKAQQAIDRAYKEGKLDLDRKTLNNNIRATSANIAKTEQQTAKLINEVATSDKKFVEAMKQLSMGPANLLVELTMRHHGIALNNNSFMALDKKQREAILAQILALTSTVYTEGKGAESLGAGAANSNPVDAFLDLFDYSPGGGIEATGSKAKPTLGSRVSEPYQSSPNMNFR